MKLYFAGKELNSEKDLSTTREFGFDVTLTFTNNSPHNGVMRTYHNIEKILFMNVAVKKVYLRSDHHKASQYLDVSVIEKINVEPATKFNETF